MNKWRSLYHIALADFLERIRRYSFLLTMGLTLYVGYTFVPNVNANYVTVAFGAYRGIYNSAWVGSMVALMASIFLTLPGFYLVNNAIDRDRRTGVGFIIAATPISRRIYILGKTLSNFSVLSIIVGVLAVEALAMQFIRGEVLSVNLWALLSPFIFIVLPSMIVVSSLAILFETVSWLRGGLGNALYLFLWLGVIGLAMVPVTGDRHQGNLSAIDMLGVSVPLGSMLTACKSAFPDYNGVVNLGYESKTVPGPLTTFRWNGVNWTPGIILGRLLWVGVALAIVLIASSLFDRFNSSRAGRRTRGSKDAPPLENDLTAARPNLAPIPLTPLPSMLPRFNPGRMLFAELRLMLKGVRLWWYVVMSGLIVASVSVPLYIAREWILPATLIWPLLIWSAMGTREMSHRTSALIFSSAHPLRRQLSATWLAGVIVALLAAIGILMRLLLATNWIGLSALIVGIFFIPSLAFTLGVYAGSSKLFEIIYVLLWYIGPVNKVPALDFTGSSSSPAGTRSIVVYLVLTTVLLGMGMLGRRRQISR